MVSLTDETGKRGAIAGSTDRKVAKEIARAHEIIVARRRNGVTTADHDRFSAESLEPAEEHTNDYMDHCTPDGLAGRTDHLTSTQTLITYTIEESRLSELNLNGVFGGDNNVFLVFINANLPRQSRET